jgi:hypothetical protein
MPGACMPRAMRDLPTHVSWVPRFRRFSGSLVRGFLPPRIGRFFCAFSFPSLQTRESSSLRKCKSCFKPNRSFLCVLSQRVLFRMGLPLRGLPEISLLPDGTHSTYTYFPERSREGYHWCCCCHPIVITRICWFWPDEHTASPPSSRSFSVGSG